MNRRVIAAAVLAPALALAAPAVASAQESSHPHNDTADCAGVLGSDNDSGFGDAGVLPIVPITIGDIVLLNGFARDRDRDRDGDRGSTSRVQCADAGHGSGSGHGDEAVLPILPITTGDIVAGNGFFEGDIEDFSDDDDRVDDDD